MVLWMLEIREYSVLMYGGFMGCLWGCDWLLFVYMRAIV